MSVTELIHAYGYIAILVGTFLEGETVLLLGGVAAHQGYLLLPWVILSAFVGSVGGDQFFFYAGRHYGPSFIDRRPRLAHIAERLRRWLARHQNRLLISFRFLWGLRAATPFVCGASGVGRGRFLLFDSLGGIVWSAALGYAGYAAGGALAVVFHHIMGYELIALLTAAVGAGIWLIWRYHK